MDIKKVKEFVEKFKKHYEIIDELPNLEEISKNLGFELNLQELAEASKLLHINKGCSISKDKTVLYDV